LEEAVQICRAMFRQEHPSFEGRYYRIADAWNLPRPVQPGGPPILIGGGGERRTLRLVAQYADACNITGDPDTVRHKVEVLRQHCAAVGRDPAEVTVTRLSTLVLTGSPDETEGVRGLLHDAAGEQASGADVGQEEDIVARVEELVDAGVQYLIVNMPTAGEEAIHRVGTVLGTRFPDRP
ncbi:MAG TPA: LLM class flavin-dependent oxidoreductase, partial [Acidimicrobiales bacterium]|nr:LLM class flavin-dependent oxidoreductase [Acidimicrobiales bacterium]